MGGPVKLTGETNLPAAPDITLPGPFYAIVGRQNFRAQDGPLYYKLVSKHKFPDCVKSIFPTCDPRGAETSLRKLVSHFCFSRAPSRFGRWAPYVSMLGLRFESCELRVSYLLFVVIWLFFILHLVGCHDRSCY